MGAGGSRLVTGQTVIDGDLRDGQVTRCAVCRVNPGAAPLVVDDGEGTCISNLDDANRVRACGGV